MDKKEIIDSILTAVLEKEASLTGKVLDFDYTGSTNGIYISVFDEKTLDTLSSKIHYIGKTYGDTVEEILTWLQTL